MKRWSVLSVGLCMGFMMIGTPFIGTGTVAAATKHSRKVCTTNPPPQTARCHAIVLTNSGASTAQPLVSNVPDGYGPSVFQSVYGIRARAVTNIGIVGAYDAPNVASDVNIYSHSFGLPTLSTCTTSGQMGCLAKVNQRGGLSYPATNSSWALETSLDVEVAHGACPGCRITLVEATNPSMDNLAAATDEAVALGAKVVSNSYGGSESSGEAGFDTHYNHPGVIMVASSGDSGYGTNYPAASPYVVAVGGTTLKVNGSRLVSEKAWNGAGSGCSQFEYKPSWQHDNKCAMRTVADVSADADPTTGAAVFDSYKVREKSGWFTVGGTSLAAPLVAGILASSGTDTNQPAGLYSSPLSAFRDIKSGTNGVCGNYLCKSAVGYDGPTGIGVLNGL